ncbi:Copper radical oxidase [Abortiporus biennis]
MVFQSFVICTLVVFVLAAQVFATDKAWNGRTTPGSTRPHPFTPYYVPPGAKGYDSSSPLLCYSGQWKESFSSRYIQKSLQSTTRTNAAMTFTFTGTGIEWFGNTDRRHGIAKVYLDGKLLQQVDAWSARTMSQQRLFWIFDLPLAKHTLKIVNSGERRDGSFGNIIDVDALVVSLGQRSHQDIQQNVPVQNNMVASTNQPPLSDLAVASPDSLNGQWTLLQKGNTGVHAMQLAVISESHAIIVDKVEHNPLTISGHPAWGALYNLKTHSVKPLAIQSNSFCAGGTFLSNGTLINVGGNPVVEDNTSAADFGDLDGLQAVRIFEPCESDDVEKCAIYENHSRIRMASPRWYTTALRISDGSAMIIGGSTKGGWINNSTTNNPTIEYFPPKNIHGSNGLPIHLPFLVDTLNSNLFPIAFSLPDGNIFMAANRDAMIYNWKTNSEQRLPRIPNGVRVTYPMTGTALLLPLSTDNNYAPEILLCGGSTVDDTRPGYDISSQEPASAQCSRMLLTEDGIAAGWQVEQMPQARIMPDVVLLPTGQVLIVNGGATGISGYGNVKGQVGFSNADHPVFTPVLYDPTMPVGQRFTTSGLPTSEIARLYHSVATLTPSGSIMVAGSNPNLDRSEVAYGTEYRVEWFNPPYMTASRPKFVKVPKKIGFGKNVEIQVSMNDAASDVRVALMDYGYVTHAVHANSRLVYLTTTQLDDGVLSVVGPPDGNIYPPGPGWLHLVVDGIPSEGIKVMIGDGKGPSVDLGAIQNLLSKTDVDQYDKHEY